MRILFTAALVGLLAFQLSQIAHTEATLPDVLTIGYDNEGKVDASAQACMAHVNDMTQWDKAATEKGSRDVCAARKHHVEAYAALQNNYKTFVKVFSANR